MADQDWTRARLELMITQQTEESYQLDYKAAGALASADGKKDEITKDASAFANSNGGTIIYGIKEFDDKTKKHLPEKIDPVDGRAFTREWLDQIVGQINPRIDGVRIIPIRVGPDDWQTCYVLEIPKGETSHQARDLKYYRRYNFESVAMRDHEIRDVMNRRKHPQLTFKVRLLETNDSKLKVLINVRNTGRIAPRQYATIVILPRVIKGVLKAEGLLGCEIDGQSSYRLTIAGHKPIFPESDEYCDYVIAYVIGAQPVELSSDRMICTLYADEMPAVKREVSVGAALAGWV